MPKDTGAYLEAEMEIRDVCTRLEELPAPPCTSTVGGPPATSSVCDGG